MKIELSGLSVAYGDKQVYRDFSAVFEDGKTTCLLGESGCGKTTLLNAVAGLIPYDGRITGTGKCGYVFQEPRLVPNLTVADNLRFAAGKHCDPMSVLREVELEEAAKLYPKELSGGMAQRVAFARAFAATTDTLLLDEPFRNLDLGLKNRMFALVSRLLGEHARTVLFVTHDVDEAVALGDRILVLGGGAVRAEFRNRPGYDLLDANTELAEALKRALLSVG